MRSRAIKQTFLDEPDAVATAQNPVPDNAALKIAPVRPDRASRPWPAAHHSARPERNKAGAKCPPRAIPAAHIPIETHSTSAALAAPDQIAPPQCVAAPNRRRSPDKPEEPFRSVHSRVSLPSLPPSEDSTARRKRLIETVAFARNPRIIRLPGQPIETRVPKRAGRKTGRHCDRGQPNEKWRRTGH